MAQSNWIQNSLNGPSDIQAVTWANQKWVAVGIYGQILSSQNGLDWKKEITNIPETQDFLSIAWSGTTYVAAGYSSGEKLGIGTIYSSRDGIEWVNRIDTLSAFRSVVWNGNLFVAVNNSNLIYTSLNGETWNRIDIGLLKSLNAVAWNGKAWVAVGSDGAILSSLDGINWVSQLLEPKLSLNALTWTGHKWVAVGWDGFCVSSVDGHVWIQEKTGMTTGLTSVVWTGDQLVAVGDSLSILSSPDGASWISKSFGVKTPLRSIATNGEQLVAVGGGDIFTSALNSSLSRILSKPPKPMTHGKTRFSNSRLILPSSKALGTQSGGNAFLINGATISLEGL